MEQKIENLYVCNYLPTQPGAVQWFRYYSFMEWLRKNKNSRVDFKHPPMNFEDPGTYFEMNMHNPKAMEAMFDTWLTDVCQESDVVIVQRLLSDAGMAILEMMKEDCKIKIITEIDDNFEIQPYQSAYQNYHGGTKATSIFKEQLAISDAVIVTQDILRDKYSKFNDNIHIIRNGISHESIFTKPALELLQNAQEKVDETGKIRILWAGSSTHKRDIEMVYPSLLEIKKQYGDKVEIIMFGGIYPEILMLDDGIIKHNQFLKYNEYLKHIAGIAPHIGIAPLCENEFNICKSNLRFLEYSAIGAVTLASNLYPFKQDIKSGHCFDVGIFGNFATELKKLIDLGPEKLRELGRNASEYAKKEYDPAIESENLEKLVIGLFE